MVSFQRQPPMSPRRGKKIPHTEGVAGRRDAHVAHSAGREAGTLLERYANIVSAWIEGLAYREEAESWCRNVFFQSTGSASSLIPTGGTACMAAPDCHHELSMPRIPPGANFYDSRSVEEVRRRCGISYVEYEAR